MGSRSETEVFSTTELGKSSLVMHFLIIVIFVLAIVISICAETTVPFMIREENCAGCGEELIDSENITPEKLRQIKLEIIKQQILQKLRLKKPPNVTHTVLPEVLVSGHVLQPAIQEDESYDRFNKEDFYGTTQQVVIFPEKTSSRNCYSIDSADRRSSCLQVKLTHEVLSRGISSAELYIYAFAGFPANAGENAVDPGSNPVKNATFTVIDVVPLQLSEGFRKRVVSIKKVKRLPGWVNFQLTPTVMSWSQRKGSSHLLEIVLDDVIGEALLSDISSLISTSGSQKPFVVIDTDSSKSESRRRRSVTCTDDSIHCCKESFTVNFTEINWSKWIIFPYAYEANFCKGSCLADISSSKYHYTTILRRYIHQKIATANNNVSVTLCCTPYIMRPLTMLYIDEENNLFKTALPNMIVESCECA